MSYSIRFAIQRKTWVGWMYRLKEKNKRHSHAP